MPCTTATTTTGVARMPLVRSRHTQRVNAAIDDGRVRFVTNAIDVTAWRAAGTSRGSETIGLP
jgi:hypothetical protein